MILSKNIRFLRKQHGWSQDYIAEQLGYKSYTTIQKWEMGTSEPPFRKLRELADLFRVDMNDLANVDLESDNNNIGTLYEITAPEFSIIEKYRTLDEYGKRNVDTLLDNEYARCNYYIETLAAHERAGATEEDKQHDYDLIKQIRNKRSEINE